MTLVRTGSCLPGCGACCTHLTLQVPLEYGDNRDVRKWVQLHGIQLVEVQERGVRVMYARIEQPCSALRDDKSCAVYGTDARPQMCAEWPNSPLAMRGLEDRCGYRFEEQTDG